nr:PAS domain S-box protein [Thiohalocapsa marina]
MSDADEDKARLPQAVAAAQPGEDAWHLDSQRGELTSPEGLVQGLSRMELGLLQTLAQARGATVSRRSLVEALGRRWYDYEQTWLDQVVSRLRRRCKHRLGRLPPVRTVRGEGYRLSEPMQVDEGVALQRARQALRELVVNFQTFFATVEDLMLVVGLDGRILFANPACEHILGYDAAEMVGMHVLDLHPAELRAEAEAIFAAMLRAERQRCPLPLQARDGALVPVETRVWPGRWNGADCFFGIIKDLSVEQEAKQRFERLFQLNPAFMALTRLPERRFEDVNQAFLDTLGYQRQQVLGKSAAALRLFPDSTGHQRLVRRLLAGERISDEALQVRRRDGEILDGLFYGEQISSQGQAYLLTVMIDITQRTRAERDLRASEQRYRRLSADLERQVQARTAEIRTANAALQASEAQYRMLFNNAADPMFIIDLHGRFLLVNDQACRHYGRSQDAFLQLHITDVDTPEDGVNAAARIARLEQEGQAAFTALHRDATGRTFPVEVRATRIRYGGIPAMLSICRDISEQTAARARIEFLAYHDSLTGMPNRILGRDRLAQAIAGVAPGQNALAVLLLDLDGFKHVNISCGQGIGDALLQSVAERLNQQRPDGAQLARLTADEFLIVLPDLHPDHCEPVVLQTCERTTAGSGGALRYRRPATQHHRLARRRPLSAGRSGCRHPAAECRSCAECGQTKRTAQRLSVRAEHENCADAFS